MLEEWCSYEWWFINAIHPQVQWRICCKGEEKDLTFWHRQNIGMTTRFVNGKCGYLLQVKIFFYLNK